MKQWGNELREVVFRMEDVVDLYFMKVAKRDDEGDGVRGALARVVGNVKSVAHRSDIVSEIEDIKETLDRLFTMGIILGLQSFDGGTLPIVPRRLYSKLNFYILETKL